MTSLLYIIRFYSISVLHNVITMSNMCLYYTCFFTLWEKNTRTHIHDPAHCWLWYVHF